MSDTVRATFTGYVVQADGPDVYLVAGEEHPDDAPIVTTHPQLFTSTGDIVEASQAPVMVGENGPDVSGDGAVVTPPSPPRRGRKG